VVAGRRENEGRRWSKPLKRQGENPQLRAKFLLLQSMRIWSYLQTVIRNHSPFWAYEWLERWAVSRRVPDAALALNGRPM